MKKCLHNYNLNHKFLVEGKLLLPNPPPLQIRPDSSNPFMLDALIDKKRIDFSRNSDSPKTSISSKHGNYENIH